MNDGGLVLTGGRPGIFAWINRDGTGQDLLQADLQNHHNTQHPAEQITSDKTTSYTEVEPLDDHSVIVIYDRITGSPARRNGNLPAAPGRPQSTGLATKTKTWCGRAGLVGTPGGGRMRGAS
jgi:hypothetical protein